MTEDKKVPKLRFPEFTDAWEQRKLSDISEKVTIKNSDLKEHETLTNSAEFGIISQSDFFDHRISNESNINNYYVVSPNDFVYNPRISVTAPVGPINRNKLNRKGIMSPLYTVFAVKNVEYSFLEFFFKSSKWHKFMRFNGDSGARSDRFSIKDSVFFSMPVPVPSLEEQMKIGKFFSELENTITLQQRKLNLLKKLKKGLLQKMFPKNGENIPEIRFPEFSEAWEQRKLGELVDVRNGKDYKHLNKGNIPVYGTGGYMLSVEKALSWNDDAIGIGRKGTIDKPYILRAPFWTVDTLFYAIPKSTSELNFLYCIFEKIDWKKKDESTGVPSLSKSIINSSFCFIPTLYEQKKIGSFFSKLDSTITLQQRKLESLQKLKKGLLQQMFV